MNDIVMGADVKLHNCPVCDTSLEGELFPGAKDFYSVSCDRCGRFQISWELSTAIKREQQSVDCVRLSGIIRRATDMHSFLRLPLTTGSVNQALIASGAPVDVNGQIDAILDSVASGAPYYGDWTDWQPLETWVARAFLPNGRNLQELCGIMKHRGLIDFSTKEEGQRTFARFYMGLAGWEHLRESRRVSSSTTQVFVAMWFHADMTTIFDNGIAPAVKACNLRPYRVDREPADNRIDDEIIAQIRRSRCLIADVTGERPSVYYEAGFAQALGIPVVWSCNSSWKVQLPAQGSIRPVQPDDPLCESTLWKDRLHFDTRQYPYILWEDETTLRTELTNRIRAWGLDLPQVSATLDH